jgi:hypothetical protein
MIRVHVYTAFLQRRREEGGEFDALGRGDHLRRFSHSVIDGDSCVTHARAIASGVQGGLVKE